MPIEVPDSVAKDIRQPVTGDSFGWEGLEPAAAKKSIVIHGTASQASDEDGFVVADYHVHHNGWGGVGVHFVTTKDSYPGKPQFGLPAGAQLQYVGDLLTWRAGTVNQNNGRIHIEISGLFTNGNGVPSEGQLRAVRTFIDWALSPNNVLPSLNYYNQVTYHNAVPGQNTSCPGWDNPQFAEWFGYLQGGAEPSWWHVPQPVIEPAPETPAASDLTPGKGGELPNGVLNWREDASQRTVLAEGANGLDVTTGQVVVPNIPVGTVIDVAGYFDFNGRSYARTVYSVTNNKWNGLDTVYFNAPTGQPSGDIPISTPEVATPDPNPTVLVDPTAVQSDVTDEQFEAATVITKPKLTLWQYLAEVLAAVVAKFIKSRSSK